MTNRTGDKTTGPITTLVSWLNRRTAASVTFQCASSSKSNGSSLWRDGRANIQAGPTPEPGTCDIGDQERRPVDCPQRTGCSGHEGLPVSWLQRRDPPRNASCRGLARHTWPALPVRCRGASALAHELLATAAMNADAASARALQHPTGNHGTAGGVSPRPVWTGEELDHDRQGLERIRSGHAG